MNNFLTPKFFIIYFTNPVINDVSFLSYLESMLRVSYYFQEKQRNKDDTGQ